MADGEIITTEETETQDVSQEGERLGNDNTYVVEERETVSVISNTEEQSALREEEGDESSYVSDDPSDVGLVRRVSVAQRETDSSSSATGGMKLYEEYLAYRDR